MNPRAALTDHANLVPWQGEQELCSRARGEQILIPGSQELPDISVPVVFHKPQQLLTIVLGEAGGGLGEGPSVFPPIAFPGIEHSLLILNLVPDGGEMTAHTEKVTWSLKDKGARSAFHKSPLQFLLTSLRCVPLRWGEPRITLSTALSIADPRADPAFTPATLPVLAR